MGKLWPLLANIKIGCAGSQGTNTLDIGLEHQKQIISLITLTPLVNVMKLFLITNKEQKIA
jgi:hypothetical protein